MLKKVDNMARQVPYWVTIQKILEESKEYGDFLSLWHSNLSSDSAKDMMRRLDKNLRKALEMDLQGINRKAALKDFWQDIFNYAEEWRAKNKSHD